MSSSKLQTVRFEALPDLGADLGSPSEGVLEINNEQHDASQYQPGGFSHPCLPPALFLWAVTPSQVRLCSLQMYVGFSGSPILIFPSHFPGSFLFCADFPWKYQVLFCLQCWIYPFSSLPFSSPQALHQYFESQLNRRRTCCILQLKKMVFNVCMHWGFSQASLTTFSAVLGIVLCDYSGYFSHQVHFSPHTVTAGLTTCTDCPVLFICFVEITRILKRILFGYPVSVNNYFWLQIPRQILQQILIFDS